MRLASAAVRPRGLVQRIALPAADGQVYALFVDVVGQADDDGVDII